MFVSGPIFCGRGTLHDLRTPEKVCGWSEFKRIHENIDKSAEFLLFVNLRRENTAEKSSIKSKNQRGVQSTMDAY